MKLEQTEQHIYPNSRKASKSYWEEFGGLEGYGGALKPLLARQALLVLQNTNVLSSSPEFDQFSSPSCETWVTFSSVVGA